jgi:predicted RNA-binding Zn ribbon-like protein
MTEHAHDAEDRTVATMQLVGGRPALDFVNTLNDRTTGVPHERLRAYADLLEWCVRVELFGRTESRRLAALAEERPAAAESALVRARALREALFDVFDGEVRGAAPPEESLALLNEVLSEGMARRRLRSSPSCKGYCWSWVEAPEGLDWMLWPIANSAAELLTSSEIDRVKECGQDDCRWLFFDESKNRSRRWCTMEDCGNRAKARRHYRRRRGGDPA